MYVVTEYQEYMKNTTEGDQEMEAPMAESQQELQGNNYGALALILFIAQKSSKKNNTELQ